jgi:methylated-DNA-[protein]-cysteine S-methyltransferase
MNVIVHPSPVGRLHLVSDGAFLVACAFDPHDGNDEGLAHRLLREGAADLRTDAVLDLARAELDAFFARRARGFTVPVALRGTEFQRRVWCALRAIPYGVTWSYGRLAEHLGDPKAVRAVGQANARNPVSIIVPCHRVIGADGSLTGFGGGLSRKRYLLALERGERTVPE